MDWHVGAVVHETKGYAVLGAAVGRTLTPGTTAANVVAVPPPSNSAARGGPPPLPPYSFATAQARIF